MGNIVAFSATGGGAPQEGGRPTPVHAQLDLFAPNPGGKLAEPGRCFDSIHFQFNPKELSLTKAAEWTRQSGRGNERSGPPQFQGPQPAKLSLELFFDSTDTQDTSVVTRVEKLLGCCMPTAATHDTDKPSPPWVLFRWGTLTGFLSYVASVSAKYTVFTPGGVPIRAICTVSLEELAGETPRQNPTSGTPNPHRVHVMGPGDSLAQLAYREYGSPQRWRVIAQANAIDDPLRIPVGTAVMIPSAEEVDHAVDAGPWRPAAITAVAHPAGAPIAPPAMSAATADRPAPRALTSAGRHAG